MLKYKFEKFQLKTNTQSLEVQVLWNKMCSLMAQENLYRFYKGSYIQEKELG